MLKYATIDIITKRIKKVKPLIYSENDLEKIIVRVTCADFVGLIGRVAGVLAHSFGINIDYVAFAGRGGVATSYLSCSKPKSEGRALSLKAVESELEKSILEGLGGVGRNGGSAATDGGRKVQISVEREALRMPRFQVSIEVRTINIPGQLNTLCRVLQELDYSIDDLVLRPSQPEHKRQTISRLLVSKKNTKGRADVQMKILHLEAAIRHLVGVRSFSTRLIENP